MYERCPGSGPDMINLVPLVIIAFWALDSSNSRSGLLTVEWVRGAELDPGSRADAVPDLPSDYYLQYT